MTDPLPAACPPSPTNAAPPAPAAPWDEAELRAVLRAPGRTFDFVLAQPGRLVATIAGGAHLRLLVALLLGCTAFASIPYGVVQGGAAAWKVAVLFGGSVLLCWPSLQVFATFLGMRLHPTQSLALSLLISGVAALFTLGFAPILWFLGATMQDGDQLTAADASRAMLVLAMAAGLLQLVRCAARDTDSRARWLLLLPWLVLVVWVTRRMARVLGVAE
ncbi:MAG: hypothetical protein WBO45_24240 [Planctomycetota bacterium]